MCGAGLAAASVADRRLPSRLPSRHSAARPMRSPSRGHTRQWMPDRCCPPPPRTTPYRSRRSRRHADRKSAQELMLGAPADHAILLLPLAVVWLRLEQRLAPAAKSLLSRPPCIFSIENHQENIQGDAPMTLPPAASSTSISAPGSAGRSSIIA